MDFRFAMKSTLLCFIFIDDRLIQLIAACFMHSMKYVCFLSTPPDDMNFNWRPKNTRLKWISEQCSAVPSIYWPVKSTKLTLKRRSWRMHPLFHSKQAQWTKENESKLFSMTSEKFASLIFGDAQKPFPQDFSRFSNLFHFLTRFPSFSTKRVGKDPIIQFLPPQKKAKFISTSSGNSNKLLLRVKHLQKCKMRFHSSHKANERDSKQRRS